MTPRRLRERIEQIDRQLKELVPWEKTLVAARRRWLVADDGAYTLRIIDNGLGPDQDWSAILGIEERHRGHPGLLETRTLIAELKEQRKALAEELPSKDETDATAKEIESRAADIRSRADALAPQVTLLAAQMSKTATLALDIAEALRLLWEARYQLERMAADADVTPPVTPQIQAPNMPGALNLATICRYFTGGQPSAVDDSLARQIRAALRHPEQEPELAAK